MKNRSGIAGLIESAVYLSVPIATPWLPSMMSIIAKSKDIRSEGGCGQSSTASHYDITRIPGHSMADVSSTSFRKGFLPAISFSLSTISAWSSRLIIIFRSTTRLQKWYNKAAAIRHRSACTQT